MPVPITVDNMSDSLNAIYNDFFEAVLKEKPILIQEISLPQAPSILKGQSGTQQ